MNKTLTQTLIAVLMLVYLTSAATLTVAADGEETESAMDFFKGDPDGGYPEFSEPLLMNASARDYRSLNGKWHYVLDEAGMSYNYITTGRYFDHEVMYPEIGRNLLEISFDSRKQLQVPGDWNSQRPELDRYRSRVLYHKIVDIQPRSDQRYFLHFGGANYTTDLFVNNQLVGRHIGGYTAFNFDITDYVKAGENTIIVRVNALLDETTIPTMRTSDFWKYGGLTRDVGLITVPETHISQYHVYLDDHQKGEIKGWVQLAGKQAGGQSVTVAIPEAGLQRAVKTNRAGRATFSFNSNNLQLWSPSSPKLYDVNITLNKNTLKDRIGFRTISTDGLNIVLNGEPIQLRGISMHEETTLHPGLSTSREDVLAQFELVKELNANFVRLAHYPHSEHAVRLADEMGLLLWSEVPIVSLIDWENADTLAVAKSQISENIARDRNRAAIIMWSIANESFPQSDARLAFLTELAATARALDDSGRPLVSALLGSHEEFKAISQHLLPEILRHPKLDEQARQRLMTMIKSSGKQLSGAEQKSVMAEEIPVVISDPLGKVVDIVGYNQYFGWYYSKSLAEAFGVDEGLMRDAMIAVMPKLRFSNTFDKPMIISEFGAGALQGLRSKEGLLWSEDYQARVFRAQLNMLDKSPYIQGYSPWVLKDFRSHLRELNGIQDTWNRKGLVSETGKKKLAFSVLAEHYKQQQ